MRFMNTYFLVGIGRLKKKNVQFATLVGKKNDNK